MLASLISERWSSPGDGEPILIDRKPIRIGHWRYGTVHLPVTVSRSDFLRDLDYYCGGFNRGNDDDQLEATVLSEYHACYDAALETIVSKTVRRDLVRHEKQEAVNILAKFCYDVFQRTFSEERATHERIFNDGPTEISFYSECMYDQLGVEVEAFEKVFGKFFDGEEKSVDEEQFNEALDQYGVVLVDASFINVFVKRKSGVPS